MAVVHLSLNCHNPFPEVPKSQSTNFNPLISPSRLLHKQSSTYYPPVNSLRHRVPNPAVNKLNREDPIPENVQAVTEVDNLGVKAALTILKFYKREISPLLPKSCRYVPTCSEYSMEAYKKYGVVKGTVLTACRLCRCNPLGGSGFDPPRWFDETSLPEE